MVRQKDIAERTGYSLSVVSRALSLRSTKSDTVSLQTKEQIKEIANQMGYVPNLQASCLRKKKYPAIGIFLPSWHDPLICELVMGIAAGANKHSLPLSFHFGMTEENYSDFIDTTSNQGNSGIISYIPQSKGKPDRKIFNKIEKYRKVGGKTLFLSTIEDQPRNVPIINIDEYFGGKLVAEYLYNQSCDKFRILSYSGKIFNMRVRGFVDFLSGKNNASEICTQPGADVINESEIYNFLTGLKNPKYRYGVFSTSDSLTRYILSFCHKNSLKIGDNLHLVSYDRMLKNKEPDEIPRIVQPFYELGYLAMNKMFELLSGNNVSSELLKPRLEKIWENRYEPWK